jgi:hypothetical protein
MPEQHKSSPLKEFAELIGSRKGTHPIPPDQYTSFQDPRYGPYKRLWSLLQQSISAPGHRKRYATDDDGNPLTAKRCAEILKLDPANVRRAWREMERDGRAETDSEGRMCLRGEFQLKPAGAYREAAEDTSELFPPSYMREINKLPEAIRESVMQDERADREIRRLCHADLKAASDFIFDQRQNARLAQAGVNIKRQKHHAPKGKENEKEARDTRVLQLLPTIERSVQTLLSTGLYKVKKTLYKTSVTEAKSPVTETPTRKYTEDRNVHSSEYRERKPASAAVSYSEAPPPSLIEWMRQALIDYPGAAQIAGKPDEAICRNCLQAGTPDQISAALIEMHRAGKYPSKSWAWFSTKIIRQHISERKTA